jgi:hypothetical protein
MDEISAGGADAARGLFGVCFLIGCDQQMKWGLNLALNLGQIDF